MIKSRSHAHFQRETLAKLRLFAGAPRPIPVLELVRACKWQHMRDIFMARGASRTLAGTRRRGGVCRKIKYRRSLCSVHLAEQRVL